MTDLEIKTPEWMAPMFEQYYRYIAIHGGRASGKSHAIAEYIIERSLAGKCDVLCAREFQKSLEFSVKKLLESKIAKFKVGHLFDVQKTLIKSVNGGTIVFIGLAENTSESIKSFENFDILWYEEAQVCSNRSLDMIRPTLRKDDAQIIFTWNPTFETDPVDVFFKGEGMTPEIKEELSVLVLEVNFTENPWVPQVMLREAAIDKERDLDKYNHIWLGKYLKHTEANIFRRWKIEEFEAKPGTYFRLGADFGFRDATVLVRCFIEGRNLYIDHEAYMNGCEVHDIPALFFTVPDSEKWPIIADSSRPDTISYLRSNGFPAIMPAVKGPRSVEEGLKFLKSFDIIVHPRCKNVIFELGSYKYKTNTKTGEIYPIPEDKNNHTIDALMYSCEGLRRVVAMEEAKAKIEEFDPIPRYNPYSRDSSRHSPRR